MAQAPKAKRLPDDAAERTDHEIIEMLFGKEAAADLEAMAGIRPTKQA